MTSSDAKLTWACGCTQDPLAPVGEWCYCTHAAEFGGQDDCKALAAAVLAALATPTDEGQK